MDRYKSFFRGIAYAGYCIVFLFAVYTFEKSIPDQIYVKAGEAIDYQFQVPVTMEIQEDSSPVAKSTNNANVRQSYIVTCRLFGIFPVKDIEVVLVDGDAVYAGGMPIGKTPAMMLARSLPTAYRPSMGAPSRRSTSPTTLVLMPSKVPRSPMMTFTA